jgi:hypothetical protein
MKTMNRVFFTLTILLFAGVVVTSCDDEEGTKGPDLTELTTTINAAKALLTSTQEGTSDGQYLRGSKVALETAVSAAELLAATTTATQVQVDNANVNLGTAVSTYQSKIITPIAVANLMAHWKFDDGTGTTANDASANNLDGAFKTGSALWGAGVPTWAADRYGVAGKALYFNSGANVEVPYNTKLNPTSLTISLWMKQDVNSPILNNQYMVAMNRWNGYKLNMQDAPKAFMTVKADNAGAVSYYDRDNDSPVLAQGSWYHVVVTFGGGRMMFYVNGVLVKDWDNTPGTPVNLSATPINLTIGQDLPTDKYSTVEGDFYGAWGGYFKGLLDEIRIYNSVLTGAQVTSLYNIEKP